MRERWNSTVFGLRNIAAGDLPVDLSEPTWSAISRSCGVSSAPDSAADRSRSPDARSSPAPPSHRSRAA
jgi:hypothetical protein